MQTQTAEAVGSRREVVIQSRYSGGTYVARAEGVTASATQSAECAAHRVARKLKSRLKDPPFGQDPEITMQTITPQTYVASWVEVDK